MLKTGRVTGALVQCPKLYQYISQMLKMNLRRFLGVIHFSKSWKKSMGQCIVSTIVSKFWVHAVTILKAVTKRDGNAMIQ